jgi:hypothetical protein
VFVQEGKMELGKNSGGICCNLQLQAAIVLSQKNPVKPKKGD